MVRIEPPTARLVAVTRSLVSPLQLPTLVLERLTNASAHLGHLAGFTLAVERCQKDLVPYGNP